MNYSTQDLSDLSGMSMRRLDRYASAGVFGDENRSPGSGGRRTYGQTDLYVACALVTLSDVAGSLAGDNEPSLGVKTALAVSDAIRQCPGMVIVRGGVAYPARWLVVRSTGVCRLEDSPPISGVAVLVDMQQVMLSAAQDFGVAAVGQLNAENDLVIPIAGDVEKVGATVDGS